MTPTVLIVVDDTLVEESDQSFNWFYKPHHKGKKRSECLAAELAELNPYIRVDSMSSSDINEESIKEFNLFMLTDCYDKILIDGWNILCRKHQVGFLVINVIGLFGSIFVDFGKHKVHDKYFACRRNQLYVEQISNSKPGIVTFQKIGRPHCFEDGDFVTINGVQGMPEVNGMEPRPIKIVDQHSIAIESTVSYGKYSGGGYVVYEKVPITMTFSSFKDISSKPKIKSPFDYTSNQMEYHICQLVYYELKDELEQEVWMLNGRYSEDQIQQFVKDIVVSRPYIKTLMNNHKLNSQKIIKMATGLVVMGKSQFLPACVFMANFAAIQVICFAGKFVPINQLLYVNWSDTMASSFVESLQTAQPDPLRQHFTNYKVIRKDIIDYANMK